MFLRFGRVQSCVRPHMMRSYKTAGPDGIRGQGPILLFGLDALDITRVVLIPGLTGSPSHRIVLATSEADLGSPGFPYRVNAA